MKNKTLNISILSVIIGLSVISCKAPMATVTKQEVAKEIPAQYSEETTQETKNSGLSPWREFFTDPHLTALIEEALKNNQELLITLQNIEIAKNDVLYKNGKLYPTVGIEGGIGVKKAGRYTSEGAGDASTDIKPGKKMPDPLGNFEAGLSMDWEVDVWKKLRTEKESAIAHYLATVEGKNFVLSNLIAEVAGNYYELLALDNQLDIIHQYIELQKKSLAMSKIQKEAAATTELSVKKFDAELAKSSSTEYTIKQQIIEKENEINALLGRYPQPIARDKNAFLNTIPQKIYTGIPSELIANRPDVKQAELELKSAKLDVEAARKEFYPTVNISSALGLEAFKPTYLLKAPESLAYNLAGSLAAPLINKSAIQANFKNADAKQLQALYEYDKTVINAYLSTVNLVNKIKNIDEYYKLKKHEADVLDESINISNLLFQNSRADYLEVMVNQRDALDAKMELVEAKAMQLNTIVNIYKNLGGGWR